MSLTTYLEEKNLGAIKTISLINLSALTYIPDSSAGVISYNALVFASGSAFEEIYHTPESALFDENEKETRAGMLWEKMLSFSIPKIRAEVVVGLKAYEERRNAAIVTDMNNTCLLVFPLRILRKKQILGKFSSKNAVLVEMRGESKNESPLITDLP